MKSSLLEGLLFEDDVATSGDRRGRSCGALVGWIPMYDESAIGLDQPASHGIVSLPLTDKQKYHLRKLPTICTGIDDHQASHKWVLTVCTMYVMCKFTTTSWWLANVKKP